MKQQDSRSAAALFSLLVLHAVAATAGGVELKARAYAGEVGPGRIEGLGRASDLSPLDWRYPVALGEILSSMGDHELAAAQYRRAIDVYPACARCWIGLAGSLDATGSDPFSAVDSAVSFGRSQTEVRTQGAVLYARAGDDAAAAREFSAALAGRRNDLDEFYSLLVRLYDLPFVLEHVVQDDDLATFFEFSLKTFPPDATGAIWARFGRRPEHAQYRDGYAAYLLRHGNVHESWEVVHGRRVPVDAPPIDSSFDIEPGASGFGWSVRDGQGVRADVVRCRDCTSAQAALRLRFDGDHNAHYFGASQIVPVEPGRTYEVSARVRHEDVTSARGPNVRITGVGVVDGSACELLAVTEDLRGTRDWYEIRATFAVPAGCQGVKLWVARPRTRKLDSYIGGEIWVESVSLVPVSVSAEQASEQRAFLPPANG